MGFGSALVDYAASLGSSSTSTARPSGGTAGPRQVQAQAGTAVQRMTDPEVVGPLTRLTRLLGMGGDGGGLSARELSSAYRSTVAMLINYRAANFARHMRSLKVQRPTQGDDEEWEPVEAEHPWRDLLARPNDHTSPMRTWKWMFMARDLVGHADFVVEHGTLQIEGQQFSLPVALHPVYPSFGYMEPIIGRVGQTVGWKYHRSDGRTKPMEAEDVLRVQRPHPMASYRSASLVEAAAYEVDDETAAAVYSRDSSRSQGRPDVMLEKDDWPGKEKLDKMSRTFFEKFAGQGVKGVPVAAGGMKIRQLQLSMRDAQFLGKRQYNRTQLFNIFECQEGLFSEKSNRANAEAAFYTFSLNTVEPNIIEVAGELEFELERLFGTPPDALRLEGPDNIVPVDDETQATINQMRVESGTPINRVLAERGEDPVEGGDTPLVSARLMPLADLGASGPSDEDPPEQDAAPVGSGVQAQRSLSDDLSGIWQDSTDVLWVYDSRDDEDEEEAAQRRAAQWRAVDHVRDGYVGEARKEAQAGLDELLRRAAEAFRDAPDAQSGMGYAAAAVRRSQERIQEMLRRIMLPAMLRFARETYDQLLADEDERAARDQVQGRPHQRAEPEDTWRQAVQEFIGNEGGVLVRQITQTTLATLRAVIDQGIEDGLGIEEIARNMEEEVGAFNRTRSKRIARTEITRASNFGARQGAMSTGLKLKKEWLSTRDDRTRPTANERWNHREPDGQLRRLSEPFDVSGEQLSYPGDMAGSAGNVINCRCAAAYTKDRR